MLAGVCSFVEWHAATTRGFVEQSRAGRGGGAARGELGCGSCG